MVTGQRRIATVSRHVIAHRARMVERRQFYRVNPGTQAQCRIGGGAHRTRIGIVTFQDRHALRSINLRQRKHLLEQLYQLTIIDRHGVSPVSLRVGRRSQHR
ncbi:hypothetical protein D3C78_1405030 [compost metagenome]